MKISCVDIQNYRKLKCCKISFSDYETIFVGANNSGKTSAMDALICFLDHNGDSGGKHKILPLEVNIKFYQLTLHYITGES